MVKFVAGQGVLFLVVPCIAELYLELCLAGVSCYCQMWAVSGGIIYCSAMWAVLGGVNCYCAM